MGVAAQEDDGAFFDSLVDDEDDDGFLASAGTFIAGVTSGISRTYAAYVGAEKNASSYASDFDREFNENNETIEEYANQRVAADADHDVFVVYFHDREDGNVSRYVVSEAQNGNWSNSRVLTQSEFEATNRTVDQWVSLDWYQSRAAGDEFEAFVDEHAEPNENLSAGDKAAYLAKYGAPESSMWNTTETGS